MSSELPAAGSQASPGWRYYLQEKVLVLFFLGFSAGLPFPLVYSTLTAWLEEAGLQRSTISTFAWLGFAYSFKFAWSPLVDSLKLPLLHLWLGQRRSWLLLAQLSVAIGLLAMSNTDPALATPMFVAFAIVVAFSSATQDIALDAYRIEIAGSEMQPILAASYQYGYRIAILVGIAGALYIAEFGSWTLAYQVMALAMGVGVAATLLAHEPDVERKPRYAAADSVVRKISLWFLTSVSGPFRDFFSRFGPTAWLLLAFISLYAISDRVLGILANPFYLDIGFSKAEIATVAKVYGTILSFVGIVAGAWAAVRIGLARCLFIATFLIASTNLFFAVLSLVGPEIWMLAVTITADNVAQGFSSTILIAYLASLTSASYTATQYALLSSLMSFFGKLIAGYSGNVQEAIGWTGFFLYAAATGIPAIILALYISRNADQLVPLKED
ncbi:MAG: MFS transporter [Woeseiaceae bacterium]|nr:MFS transporter [Woeseiaceae bacterium]